MDEIPEATRAQFYCFSSQFLFLQLMTAYLVDGLFKVTGRKQL